MDLTIFGNRLRQKLATPIRVSAPPCQKQCFFNDLNARIEVCAVRRAAEYVSVPDGELHELKEYCKTNDFLLQGRDIYYKQRYVSPPPTPPPEPEPEPAPEEPPAEEPAPEPAP